MSLKKVFQDKDNCLDACIATLLGVALKDVPETRWLNENSDAENFWLDKLNKWLVSKHKSRLILMSSKKDILLNLGMGYSKHFILVIKGNYADNAHAVIVNKDLKIIHDPAHPSCLKQSFTEIYGLDVKTEYALFLAKD